MILAPAVVCAEAELLAAHLVEQPAPHAKSYLEQ